jgi:hypothetical protein
MNETHAKPLPSRRELRMAEARKKKPTLASVWSTSSQAASGALAFGTIAAIALSGAATNGPSAPAAHTQDDVKPVTREAEAPAVPLPTSITIAADTTMTVENATVKAEAAPLAKVKTGIIGAEAARELGKQLAAERGWTGAQWEALNRLFTKESGWNMQAMNRSSGAYGIPQALPGSKMGTVASDWKTNAATQITWGLNYIAGRYGTPVNAMGHSASHGWY